MHGIKKKKIRWVKEPKEEDLADTRVLLTTMKRKLTMARNEGFRIIYIDETMFTRKTVPDTEWSHKKSNMRVDCDKLNEPTRALLCGISKEKGVEHFEIYAKSVNIDKFKIYCQNLRAKNEGQRLCLFMDNLSTHTSKKSQKEMKRLGIKFIYNVPYEPE